MKILEDGRYKIMPMDIVYKGDFLSYGDRFGNHETDCSAWYIVKMCQERDNPNWSPFSKEEIEARYRSAGQRDGYTFNNLIWQEWIVEKDGMYWITDRFVDLSFQPGLWRQSTS